MKLFGGVRGRGSATGRQRPAETHPSRAEEPEQPLLRSQVSQQPFEIDWESVWQREAAARQQAPSAGLSPRPAAPSGQPKGKKAKRKKKKRRLAKCLVALALLAGLYCVAVFSNIPFIAKWRAIYIETAMGTMNHQWLATYFIPPFVIDQVMEGRDQLEADQAGLASDWGDSGAASGEQALTWKKLQKVFEEEYPEIDQASLKAYLEKQGDAALDEDGYLVIDEAGLEEEGTDIETVHGDQVLALDTFNGITICKVKGEGFVGRLAIVKDPSQVGVALAPGYGSVGARAADIAEESGAVLVTNASGFYDPEGHGNGGVAHGLVVSGGQRYNDAVAGSYKTIGIDENNRLYVGSYQQGQYRDAVEFKPALIVNGEKVVEGSAGWGVQPRTAIGQTESGSILLLVVDGRAPGYSIGCTVGDCADILARYGAVQACNLDGGSSSIMVYQGREISRPSAADKTHGRHLPNGIAVYPKKK